MKKITFILQNRGGSYLAKVEGDKKKETWGKIDNTIIWDYELRNVSNDAKRDGFKIEIRNN